MDVLILVDLQNDFMPGGALAVKHGDEVVAVANRLAKVFDLVVATQDWHPENHGSFITAHPEAAIGDVVDLAGIPQVVWPVHCVQETEGAAFHSGLNQTAITKVFPKGMEPSVDSYSGFFDNDHRCETGLADYLKSEGVKRVFVLGLATDYCVKYTALDARELGFATYLVEDGCRGVELEPGDIKKAIEEMKKAGVEMVTSDALPTAQ